jgi:2-phospho-L-lactate guanylyltransferase
MQATVSSFDPATWSGTVLLDDGVEPPFTAEALAGTGLRHLRPGQRVRVDASGEGGSSRVEHLQLVTLA